ncbi:hypothetical protein AX17_001064 [Amanita inopinata Kibby_2008]|nr:hypothetical protein AX17_001064 [Amanita inopinata Kibby_2008]
MSPTVLSNRIDISRVNSTQHQSTLKASTKASTFPRAMPPPPLPSSQTTEPKKGNRRSNKPIINWLQRKLVGTVKRSGVSPHGNLGQTKGRGPASRAVNRLTSSPPSQGHSGGRPQVRTESSAAAVRRKTISLNGDEDVSGAPNDDEDDLSYRTSSLARESTWSPASVLEADDDASVRPLPPSLPPSPSPSRSSSSYLSHPHTFRSMAASTKPTTLLSIDLNGNGMAHIAQAPMTPPPHLNRFSQHHHARQSSLTSNSILNGGGSITFSALPSSSSRPSSTAAAGSVIPNTQQTTHGHLLTVQAPLHTTHHPRNNPRPSSPPLDNASVLTLASSAFGIPGRLGIAGYGSTSPSALGAGDSASHFDGSVVYPDAESTSIAIEDDDRLEERDLDASVRALRPRSSRRGSWESEASDWSARIQQVPGTPSISRERSLRTGNSIRTGGFSADNVETDDEHCVNGNDGSGSIEMSRNDAATGPSSGSPHMGNGEPSASPVKNHSSGVPVDKHVPPPVLRSTSTDTIARSSAPRMDHEAGKGGSNAGGTSHVIESDKPADFSFNDSS